MGLLLLDKFYDKNSALTTAESRELQHISKLSDEISYQTDAPYLPRPVSQVWYMYLQVMKPYSNPDPYC
jgi:hypothetical protein